MCLVERTLAVSHHSFYVHNREGEDSFDSLDFTKLPTGLMNGDGYVLGISLQRAAGEIPITIVLLPQKPKPNLARFSHIVDGALYGGDDMEISSPSSNDDVYFSLEHRWYGLRVNMGYLSSSEYDYATGDDHYLLELWPSDQREPIVVHKAFAGNYDPDCVEIRLSLLEIERALLGRQHDRIAAIRTIGLRKLSAFAPSLEAVLLEDPSPSARVAAVEALARLDAVSVFKPGKWSFEMQERLAASLHYVSDESARVKLARTLMAKTKPQKQWDPQPYILSSILESARKMAPSHAMRDFLREQASSVDVNEAREYQAALTLHT